MHIGFITPEFITDEIFSGGLANYLYRVSKALIALGHEIDIIVLSKSSSHPFKYDEIQIHPIKLYMAKHRLNKITRRRLYSTLRNLDFSHKAYKRIAQIHKDNPFDVVQLSSYQACGLHTALFAKVPHVSRISSYQPACNKYSRRNRTVDTFCSEWLERLQLQYCRHIYAPSHLLKHILLKKARASQIDVIRTPFFMEEDSWDTSFVEEYDLLKKKYLLFFGRYQLLKGFHILAQALPDILDTHPDCYALFVGRDGPSKLAKSMKEYTLSLNAKNQDRLMFIDQTRHSKLYPIIANAHLVVLPSLIDNLPNALLEAMALSRPVVGTIGASFDEVIEDGINGYLIPGNDIRALSTKVIEVWNNPSLDSIGQEACIKSQEFLPDRILPKLIAYYQSVINSETPQLLSRST